MTVTVAMLNRYKPTQSVSLITTPTHWRLTASHLRRWCWCCQDSICHIVFWSEAYFTLDEWMDGWMDAVAVAVGAAAAHRDSLTFLNDCNHEHVNVRLWLSMTAS
eukprot:TRINITY_DN23051_c0_g1_i1.p2 TRINITY_DN23051_c0_g1~~TRINITY_DN23051_c0_g1_i1.p2  ORF type:complete len:105 (+),score=10.84 TRINITY_DN23051_c0_g1_i1:326-640(+)